MQPDMEKNETEMVTDSEVKGQTVEDTTMAPPVDQQEKEIERKEETVEDKKEDEVDEQPSKTLESPEKTDQTEEKHEHSAKKDDEQQDKEAVKEPENTEEKEEANNEDIADDNSSASSSPSALHIHLEEDKEENGVDPTLPQVSSVVSLSEGAAQNTPDNSQEPPAKEESSPSQENNPRRATLKLKRGIEISFEVDRDGQPVTSLDQNQQQRVEVESGSSRKKAKLAEQLELQDDPELSGMDVNATVEAITRVQKDIRTLRFMAKQKEKEWNYILKLMKFKEEQQAKLMRRKEVLRIINSTEKVTTKKTAAVVATSGATAASFTVPTPSSHVAGAPSAAIPAPPSVYSSSSSLHSLINQSLTAIMSNKGMKVTSQPTLPTATASGAVAVPPASPSAAAAAAANSSRHPRQRPILPKTSMQGHAYHEAQLWNNSALLEQSSPSSHDLADMRRQGTVSVQSLIADYRAKHPEEVPIRGRRMRNKADQESPTPPASDNSGMSFKDVLVQFAKLSRGQGQGPEVTPTAAVSNNGSSSSSSAAALQSLAAARTARSSTSPALSGSILQSALSGSRNANSGFAPTLAQLLTSTAEQQQQQQQAPVLLGQTSIAPTSAEVLTLSNLLATSKGHVTITSDRENRNDDVILIGNSSQNRSGSSTLSSGPKAANGDIPKCQGCNERVAQFVCAGCSSQWYCSRECQVAAWEDHSENCVG